MYTHNHINYSIYIFLTYIVNSLSGGTAGKETLQISILTLPKLNNRIKFGQDFSYSIKKQLTVEKKKINEYN